jgi:hypothetical protein
MTATSTARYGRQLDNAFLHDARRRWVHPEQLAMWADFDWRFQPVEHRARPSPMESFSSWQLLDGDRPIAWSLVIFLLSQYIGSSPAKLHG